MFILLIIVSLSVGVESYSIVEYEYEKVVENESLELYLNKNNLAIQIIDSETNYKWYSVIENLVEGENNPSWENFMSSGIAIDYFPAGKTSTRRTDLVSDEQSNVVVDFLENGFKAKVEFEQINLYLEILVTLEDDQLVVEIPSESIEEKGDYRLASLYLFPFLGSVRQDNHEGYLFIPDGSGNLINFKGKDQAPRSFYRAPFFGKNAGIESLDQTEEEKEVNPPHDLKIPVFGLAHLEKEQAVFSIIEKGQYYADLMAYPAGISTEYNWITPRYNYRKTYMQPTSRAMGGMVLYENIKNPEDIKIRYNFLNKSDANYIGMAKRYQSYLVDKGKLSKDKVEKGDIPLRLDVLGAESKRGLFSPNVVTMTTARQLQNIIRELKKEQIENLLIVYKGWNTGGLSGNKPYTIEFEDSLGTKSDFENLINFTDKHDINLYFYDDYVKGYNRSSRFSYRQDAAKRINNRELEVKTNKQVYDRYYFLSLKKTEELIHDNIKQYQKINISNAAVDKIGYTLFSNRDQTGVNHRVNSAEAYQSSMKELTSELNKLVLYEPNEYMLEFTEAYFDIPMNSSNYIYFDKEIPFKQIVFKGYLDYFAPYTNFSGNKRKQILKHIEYGAFPSFIITGKSAFDLLLTNSNDIFTSAFSDWKDDIVNIYNEINEVLNKVKKERIIDRQYIKEDIIKVCYTNGYSIIVNYTESSYIYKEFEIPAENFKLIEGRNYD